MASTASERLSPAALAPSISLSLASPLDSAAAPNMLLLPRSAFQRLKAAPCALLDVTSAQGVHVVLQCGVSNSVSLPNAVCHPDTLALLEGREATAAVRRTPVDDAATVALHRIDGEGGCDVAGATFVKDMLRQVVFDGMVWTLRLHGACSRFRVECPRDVARVGVATTVSVVDPLCELTCGATSEASQATARNVLLVGAAGVGKTHCLRERCEALPSHYSVVKLPVHRTAAEPDLPTKLQHIDKTFASAAQETSCAVCSDDLDLLFRGQTDAHRGAIGRAIVECLERYPTVVMLASAAATDEIDPRLLNCVRRGDIVHVQAPASDADRAHLLRSMVGDSCSPEAIAEVAARCAGYVAADLRAVVCAASAGAFAQHQQFSPTDAALRAAVAVVRPAAIDAFEVSVPTVRWSDIGGSDTAKAVLQQAVAWASGSHGQLMRDLGMSPPRGVLLYGPPGCSKTMLAKALACESKLNFVSVKGPEVFSKWVGDSEKAVREIFARARGVAPCVVFIDELDGMCAKRGGGGVGDRVISQFLTELDGLPAALSAGADRVIFVAATNRPDNIDPAVLRPGRIDRKVLVGLPSAVERNQIAGIGLRGVPVSSVNAVEQVAAGTAGYTGAEVVAVCKEAAYQALAEDEDADIVTDVHIERALRAVRPGVSAADVAWYERLRF